MGCEEVVLFRTLESLGFRRDVLEQHMKGLKENVEDTLSGRPAGVLMEEA